MRPCWAGLVAARVRRGVRDMPEGHEREVREANELVKRTAALLMKASDAGAEIVMEHPCDRGDPKQKFIFLHEDHAPVWEMEEIKTLLHHLHAQRDVLWPVGGGGAALRVLLGRASRVLGGCSQELSWLTRHPLWLPTPLAPLFKALRWEAADAAYLLAALLTDQKVILHTHALPSLFCASCAARVRTRTDASTCPGRQGRRCHQSG